MKTIFHFNCVACGAHPKEELFDKFSWPKDTEMLDSFIDALGWILPNIQSASITPKLTSSIGQLIQLIGDRPNATPLHKLDGPNTLFTIKCPLCGTEQGPRPYDPYFNAWIAWHIVGGVQIGNLLFESSELLARVGGKNNIVLALKKAIESLNMQICFCGRPTTALTKINSEGEGLCRWCMDAQAETIPTMQDNSLHVFVNNLNLSRFLAVTPEAWNSIRAALLKDFEEDNRTPIHLEAALIGNPTGKWLEPWRKIFHKLNSWPEIWPSRCCDDKEMQEEPSIPLSYRDAYEVYRQLPREITQLFSCSRSWRPISPPIRNILEAHSLVEIGQSTEIEGFLKQLPIEKVRDISNRLGTGKGRTKEIIINKILSGATPDEITNTLPEIKIGWIKTVHSPFDILPQEWVRYQLLKAKFLKDFIRRKFWSYNDIRDSVPKRIELHPDCSDYCKEKEKSFRWSQNLNLNDAPPWYPGCMCHLMGDEKGVRSRF
jgi:hypothetical protein